MTAKVGSNVKDENVDKDSSYVGGMIYVFRYDAR